MTGARRLNRRTVLLGATAFSIGRARAAADFGRRLTAGHLNKSALDQRADLADLNISLRPDLEAKGLVFNEVDKAVFRARLVEAGFYKEWRGRYGDAAWAMLEKYSGDLS
jgi:TRAP-type transport system periplasmic protein